MQRNTMLWRRVKYLRQNKKRPLRLLRQAIASYRGDFIEESPYEEFLTEERESQRDNLLRAMFQLLDLCESARRWDEVIPLCRRALTRDAYREDFYRFLILAQLKLGARREALADYHRYEEMMIRELDLLPSARMKQLADQATSLS
jgi:DNA-binding SARP family transcriptional activator